MAKRITIVLTGTEELNKKLRELSGPEAKKAIRQAARPALKPTLDRARSLAPVKTGRLKKSIKIRSIARSRTRVGARVTTSKSDNQFTGRTFYAAFQEYGWKTGSRRRETQAVARRIAAQLRAESRRARASGGGLARRGTQFRARQEAYFQREGARRAAMQKPQVRRQVEPKEFLKRAATQTRSKALSIYRQGILDYIRSVARG